MKNKQFKIYKATDTGEAGNETGEPQWTRKAARHWCKKASAFTSGYGFFIKHPDGKIERYTA